jgi:hypothetical protein
MNANKLAVSRAVSMWLLAGAAIPVFAQQPQVPTLQVCNITAASGGGLVQIQSRVDAQHQGTFEVVLELKCDSKGAGYPTGSVAINKIDMSDSTVQGSVVSTSLEQVTTTGKHTPTLYVNGRCKAEAAPGCRFWLMVANNREANATDKSTPDIVSFLVFNGTGQRVAYGPGPVLKGDIKVAATSN